MTVSRTKRIAAVAAGAVLAAHPLATGLAAQDTQPGGAAADLVRPGEVYPAVDVDAAGGALAVTVRRVGHDSYGTVLATYREPDGTWGETVPVSGGDTGNSAPAVAAGKGGSAVVVWPHDNADGRTTVMSRTRRSDGTWSRIERLTGYHDIVDELRVRANADGAAAVSWQQGRSGLAAAYRAPGGSWEAGMVATDVSPAADTRLAVDDSDDTAHIAYPTGSGDQDTRLLLTSRTASTDWTPPEVVVDGEFATVDDLEVSHGMTALAVYTHDAGVGALRVLRQHRPDGPLVQEWTDQRGFDAELAFAGGGQIRVLWSRGAGDEPNVLRTRAYGGGEWTPGRRIAQASEGPGSGYEFLLGYDLDIRGDGTGLVAYHEYGNGTASIGPQLMRRVGPDGAVSAEVPLDGHVYSAVRGAPSVAVGEFGFGAIGWVEQPGSTSVTTRVRNFTP